MSVPDFSTHKKAIWIAIAILLTTSVSGFFMGLRQTNSEARAAAAEEEHHDNADSTLSHDVPRIVDYRGLAKTNYKANASWENNLGKLKQPAADLYAEIFPDDAARDVAIRERATRRAYDGAPPVVPHPVDQISPANCMACHGEGAQIKGRIASKMSHPFMQNCTQCHVPVTGPEIKLRGQAGEALALNDFIGFMSPGKGTRAYEGAPPTIPHPTSMRSDCMSCHGPNGVAGLKTSHPYRQSCTQCHAPSAELDQRLFEHSVFPPKAPEVSGK
ncbi:MAG: diheme cytochrome c precursor [Verrucomicrobia bacterium]|nr:diheme cytochrome c precursor [Verrucomicrobiota bacterium]